MSKRAVYLLDADPSLTEALDPETAREARPYAVARVREVPAGEWLDAERWSDDDDRLLLGLFVLDGLLTRDLTVRGRSTCELLGAGDLLRPWDEDVHFDPAPLEVSWWALEPVRLAVLDARFAAVTARWPALGAAMVARALRRSRWLAFHFAVSQVTGLEDRLILLFAKLAERWGTVGPEGVTLRLNLTHETLAKLVGARRPSVSLALGELSGRGLISRNSDRSWLLRGDWPLDAEALPEFAGFGSG